MVSQNFPPDHRLRNFIHHYNVIDYSMPLPAQTQAIAHPSLATGFFFIYRIDQPMTIRIGRHGEPLPYNYSHFISPGLLPVYHSVPQDVGLIRVIFHPGRIHQWLQFSLLEIHGKLIDTEDVLGQEIRHLQEKICEVAAKPENKGKDHNRLRLDLLDKFFLKKDCSNIVPSFLDAVNTILLSDQFDRSGGKVKRLLHELNTTRRTLERHFLKFTGLTPNEYIAVFRYCKALELISKENATSFTKIAHDLDYFDQSHFNKEFARFMDGHSPTEALQIIKSKLRGDEDLTNNGLLFG